MITKIKTYRKAKPAPSKKLLSNLSFVKSTVCYCKNGRAKKQLMAWLMIFLISLITTNTAFNLHTHILNDGTIITHAHPFKGTPSNSNKHNHNDLEYLHLSFLLSFNIESSYSLTIVPEFKNFKYTCQNAGIYRVFQKRVNTNKAPPKTTASFSI